jgi:hypothetical protein
MLNKKAKSITRKLTPVDPSLRLRLWMGRKVTHLQSKGKILKMKKIVMAAVAACVVALTAGAASAADYAQVQAGSQFGNHVGGGATWSVAVGRDFGAVRAEVEYYGANLGNYGQAHTGNVNVYLEPVKLGNFTPFIGGGVGYGRIINEQSVVLNAQVGTSYALTSDLNVVAAYRYTAVQADGEHTSAATVGLRYTF